MYKINLILIMLFAMGPVNFAQWVIQSPSPTNVTLRSVNFIDANFGWAIGESGLILHTTNGGLNWTKQKSGTLQFLNDVAAIDSENSIVVGHWGTLLKTSDGGKEWDTISIGTTNSLYSVKFIDKNNGWILEGTEEFPGDKILHTTNGGISWVNQKIQFLDPYPNVIELNKIFFIDLNNGWAVGNQGVVFKTVDGGITWEGFSVDNYTNFRSVSFVDSNNGWVVGTGGLNNDYGGVIYKTTDGGINWFMQLGKFPSHLTDITTIDLNTALAVGTDGTILRTTDGGSNWKYQVNPVGIPGNYSDNIIWSINEVDKNNGWAVGFSGIILNTTDGGKNWFCQMSGTSYGLTGLCFVDSKNGWAVGSDGTILKTTNSGEFWERKPNPFLGYKRDFYDVSFIDKDTGWIVGSQGSILKTYDAGNSWVTQTSGSTELFYGVKFLDENYGWIVGKHGLILQTIDGGNNWRVQSSGTSNELLKIICIDKMNAWIIGRNGTILHTKNGGLIWLNQSMDSTYFFRGITFSNINNGWIVGTSGELNDGIFTYYTDGVILHTSDDGVNWEKQIYPRDNYSSDISDVFFIDNDNGWVIGSDSHINSSNYQGFIFRTTNGGKTWVTDSIAYGSRKVVFTDIENGWIFNGISKILHTTNGGISDIREENRNSIPKDYLLWQNYPNPFNPTTTIKFSIPKLSFVTLKIYNLLGQEVGQLVNGIKSPGIYEVKFNGEEFSSGVYFYRIQADNYSVTRKLIILK
ncbi:MAG: YCF48-related protein [Ignavibacteriaceae bacterium]|jgi:photosystem II stability/assembly factor-like uncharacterized protein